MEQSNEIIVHFDKKEIILSQSEKGYYIAKYEGETILNIIILNCIGEQANIFEIDYEFEELAFHLYNGVTELILNSPNEWEFEQAILKEIKKYQ